MGSCPGGHGGVEDVDEYWQPQAEGACPHGSHCPHAQEVVKLGADLEEMAMGRAALELQLSSLVASYTAAKVTPPPRPSPPHTQCPRAL